MELTEIEVLVAEAETRVERLRSLYDQYFMGIEKIEPQTARKDVERRIQTLRRTQIRNTALRFRFQNTLLRFNTFAAHWMRICRQIEDGTYKHHLRKAKARFAGPPDAKDAKKKADALEYGDTEPPGPAGYDLDEDMDMDVDFDEGLDAPDVQAALRPNTVPQDLVAPPVAGRAPAAMTRPGATPVRDSSLDRPTERAPAPAATTIPAKAPPLPARAGAPPLPNRAAPPLPPGAMAAMAAKPPPPLPAAAARSMAPPLPNRPPPPPAAKPPPPAPAPAVRPAAAPPPVAAKTVPAPAAAKAAPAPAASVARSAQAREAATSADERERQTYSKYVESRKSLGESTAAINQESFAKSLRDSREKLRLKHPGKTVDFDVQVKDGKTVLKPIVR